MQLQVETKTCTKCEEILPADKFYPRPRAGNGLDSWCGKCHIAAATARYEKLYAERCSGVGIPVPPSHKMCAGPCGQDLPIKAFSRRTVSADGHMHMCKKCISADSKRRYRADWAGARLLGTRGAAKAKGIAFDLTRKDLEDQPNMCPVLGIPMIYESVGKRQDGSASVDRIDNTKGYVPSNVVIVSWRANRLKSDACPGELRCIEDFYSERNHVN